MNIHHFSRSSTARAVFPAFSTAFPSRCQGGAPRTGGQANAAPPFPSFRSRIGKRQHPDSRDAMDDLKRDIAEYVIVFNSIRSHRKPEMPTPCEAEQCFELEKKAKRIFGIPAGSSGLSSCFSICFCPSSFLFSNFRPQTKAFENRCRKMPETLRPHFSVSPSVPSCSIDGFFGCFQNGLIICHPNDGITSSHNRTIICQSTVLFCSIFLFRVVFVERTGYSTGVRGNLYPVINSHNSWETRQCPSHRNFKKAIKEADLKGSRSQASKKISSRQSAPSCQGTDRTTSEAMCFRPCRIESGRCRTTGLSTNTFSSAWDILQM